MPIVVSCIPDRIVFLSMFNQVSRTWGFESKETHPRDMWRHRPNFREWKGRRRKFLFAIGIPACLSILLHFIQACQCGTYSTRMRTLLFGYRSPHWHWWRDKSGWVSFPLEICFHIGIKLECDILAREGALFICCRLQPQKF
jgi:hypothetical protein